MGIDLKFKSREFASFQLVIIYKMARLCLKPTNYYLDRAKGRYSTETPHGTPVMARKVLGLVTVKEN